MTPMYCGVGALTGLGADGGGVWIVGDAVIAGLKGRDTYEPEATNDAIGATSTMNDVVEALVV